MAVWQTLPDIREYFEVFDDYLDFSIYPWDLHGVDQGVLYIERKNAFKFLKLGLKLEEAGMLPLNLYDFTEGYRNKPDANPKEDVLNYKKNKPITLKDKAIKKRRQKVEAKTFEEAVKQAVSKEVIDIQRSGFKSQDMVESITTINRGKNPETGNDRRWEITTRSVNFDVPDEDSINPETWDWTKYVSPKEVVEHKRKQAEKRKEKRIEAKRKRQQQQGDQT